MIAFVALVKEKFKQFESTLEAREGSLEVTAEWWNPTPAMQKAKDIRQVYYNLQDVVYCTLIALQCQSISSELVSLHSRVQKAACRRSNHSAYKGCLDRQRHHERIANTLRR